MKVILEEISLKVCPQLVARITVFIFQLPASFYSESCVAGWGGQAIIHGRGLRCCRFQQGFNLADANHADTLQQQRDQLALALHTGFREEIPQMHPSG